MTNGFKKATFRIEMILIVIVMCAAYLSPYTIGIYSIIGFAAVYSWFKKRLKARHGM